MPGADQTKTLPCLSAIVIIVLLKLACIWAIPWVTPLAIFFFFALSLVAINLPSLTLFPCRRLWSCYPCRRSLFSDYRHTAFTRAFSGPGICARALAPNRQALFMAHASPGADIH